MGHVLLTVRDLSVDFKTEDSTIHALQHISCCIEAGKTLALVGESGSGKSVSALSIMGLLPSPPVIIRHGKIELHLEDETSIDLLSCTQLQFEKIRGSRIGMIFQEPMSSLNPLMKCGRQVAETMMLHRMMSKELAIEETLKLFEEVKLPEPKSMLDRYPHELSGGQKQRVMIAIAICCNPMLLIADEPTTALDVTVQKSILDLLKDLQIKRGMSILFITHDLNLVKRFADDVMILYKSKMVEFGPTDRIFNHPEQAYTKGLLNCRPSDQTRVRFLKTIQESVENNSDMDASENQISIKSYEARIEQLKQHKAILELKDLFVWYPTKRNFIGNPIAWYKAVNGVNLTIHEGETMGLVGESGCGKTTIGKSIVQLTEITQGTIWYKGKDIRRFSKSELNDYRKEVQIIFQDPYSSLNPRIPIGDAIREPIDVHGLYSANERSQKVEELLSKVGLLPEHARRYPHEFSGGQRQRICIARALSMQPSFIICDESVSALDVSVQAQVLNLLVSLRDEFNLSYLFISHDLSVVRHISDQIAVMQSGIIEELNDAERLYHQPEEPYTKKLLASSY